MTLKQLLFSPKGRIGRVQYILFTLTILIITLLIHTFFPNRVLLEKAPLDAASLINFLLLLGVLVLHIMVTIKRFHDFNITGYATMMLYAPYLGLLVLIALILYPGTDGDNRFGRAPGSKSEPGDEA